MRASFQGERRKSSRPEAKMISECLELARFVAKEYPFCIELEQKTISPEKALRSAGYHGKKLYLRHLEKSFKAVVNAGKTLRIQFKKLVHL